MKHFVIPPKGGHIAFVDQSTGEARELFLAPGVYPLSRFAPMRREGEVICTPGPRLDGQHFFESGGNFKTIRHPGAFESAANPSFRMTPVQRQAREMQVMLRRTEVLAKRAERALSAVRRSKGEVPKIEHMQPVTNDGMDAGEVSST